MKRLFLFVLLIKITQGFSQADANENLFFNGNTYYVFTVKVSEDNLKYFDVVENKNHTEHVQLMSNIDNSLSFFAINAFINDSACSPVGYYVKNYQELQPVNLKDGPGNFYLKPNGALLITDKEAVICESDAIKKYDKIRIGFQSGPMLVVDSTINKNFNATSANKNIRAGVGAYTNSKGSKILVFAVSKVPVTFYEFATLFLQNYSCKNALCLESVNCAINLPYIDDYSGFTNAFICNYLIYKEQ